MSNAIYLKPTETAWQEAWKITETVLLMKRDAVTAKGAKFFLVGLTNGPQVHPDSAFRAGFTKSPGDSDLFYADRRLEQFAHPNGIPILLLAPIFQEQASGHKAFFHGFKDNLGGGHWNQAGHRLAGTLLAERLCGRLN